MPAQARGLRSGARQAPQQGRGARQDGIMAVMIRRFPLFVLVTAAVWAQGLIPPPDAAARVDDVFARFRTISTPGCAVGVSIDDKPVLTAAYGMADLEHDVPIRPDTIF